MKKPSSASMSSRGFALVVTLTLMILLTLIAVGLLSLSAVSVRTGSQAKAEAEARANARMALMFAIGELQKQMGPDQRISANGAIISNTPVKNPHWTGVWNSWKAGTGEASQHSTIGSQPDSAMRPSYQARREDYFRSWLLSLNPGEVNSVASPINFTLTGSSMPESGATAVELVGKGSLGTGADPKDYVSARLLSLKAPTGTNPAGRYGWWVGDESQKARIMDDSYLASSSSLKMADRIFRQQAPGSTGTSIVTGLENITNQQQLDALPSLQSLDLVSGVNGNPADKMHAITPFSYGVLADVREGGLKRDLSTLLERPISTSETQDQYMLYRFDTQGQERVPIQDIAAYYQLYDSDRDPNKTKGIRYSSSPQNNHLANGIQVAAPDFYANNDTNSFKREYTSLYRSPVPIKIQMVMAASAEETSSGSGIFVLRLGLAPVVTLWNPNNVPIVMNDGDPARLSQQMRFNYLPFMVEWNRNGTFRNPVSIAYAAMGGQTTTGKPGWALGGGRYEKATIFDMYFSSTTQTPIVFQPGEVRVFSYPFRSTTFDFKKKQNDSYNPDQQVTTGWKTEYLKMPCSAWDANNNPANVRNNLLVINPTDNLQFQIKTEKDVGVDWTPQQEAPGAGINFMMIQKIYQSRTTNQWFLRNYQLCSRTGSGTVDFNDSLIKKGYGSLVQGALSPMTMISTPGQWYPFLHFALMAGSEVSEDSAGPFKGRKFTSRPFLHSTAMSPPRIDKDDAGSLYNYGWNWHVEAISGPNQVEVGVAANNRSGYYGGGNMFGKGSTHVVQQEIPVVPPMSIAALSHAHLGGFSLANAEPNLTNPVCTATGSEGLFPRTLQAIGNSYAHPHIPAGKAFTNWSRQYDGSNQRQVTMADHSYLANKALWDEFFFSSITPQKNAVRVFETPTRSAKSVAEDFFFNNTPLPNRRFVPAINNLSQTNFNTLFSGSEPTKFTDGLADKIASHLIVEGPFNVNSTSVDAWKTVLSSLKGKPVAYLDKQASGVRLETATPDGSPVGSFSLPNGGPYRGTTISGPGTAEQWTGWRDLSETEIDELANSIVKQVKLRGPFLSLSEFVNRRLDSSNEDLSVKGALQAALDDPSVSINASFRSGERAFSQTEVDRVGATFKKALDGPVAYGSAAYVDQADVLRNFSAQLTPRGDTFVIRTYGDSLDASGKVQARAWCEAVVQRVTKYVDSADEAHVKQADLTSNSNKAHGRRFEIITFRWMGPSEV